MFETPKKFIDTKTLSLPHELRFKRLINTLQFSHSFDTLMSRLQEQILTVYDVEMATIYLADSTNKRISSWIALPGKQFKNIKIPINKKSIAGYVAKTLKPANIINVYDKIELTQISPALSFDQTWDKKTGHRTKQVLAVPFSYKNSLLGVIQLMNKKRGKVFLIEEEKRAHELARTLEASFYNQYKLSATMVGDNRQ